MESSKPHLQPRTFILDAKDEMSRLRKSLPNQREVFYEFAEFAEAQLFLENDAEEVEMSLDLSINEFISQLEGQLREFLPHLVAACFNSVETRKINQRLTEHANRRKEHREQRHKEREARKLKTKQ